MRVSNYKVLFWESYIPGHTNKIVREASEPKALDPQGAPWDARIAVRIHRSQQLKHTRKDSDDPEQ